MRIEIMHPLTCKKISNGVLTLSYASFSQHLGEDIENMSDDDKKLGAIASMTFKILQ